MASKGRALSRDPNVLDPNVRGTKSKLTPELHETIVGAVRAGNYIDVAAQYAGISRETLYTWIKKGRAAKTGAYHAFAADMDKALAQSEVRDLALIGKAAEEQWQAAAWRLERRMPDRYGKRARLDATVTVTAKPMLDYAKLTLEEKREFLRMLEKASPDADDPALGSDGRPALELLPAADIDGEVLDETDVA